MGAPSKKELALRIVGILEPTHRDNSTHPLTGRRDNLRADPGNRWRIEEMEYIKGHVICGHSFSNGDLCVAPPLPDKHRCEDHVSLVPEDANIDRINIHDKRFNKCSVCGDRDCKFFTPNKLIDSCVIERSLFSELMEQKADVVAAGRVASTQFDNLVWDYILLDRILRKIAQDDIIVTELKNYVVFGDQLTPVTNNVEHPLLKHVPKLQQSATQLASVLMLTPKDQVDDAGDTAEAVFRGAFSALIKESHKMFMEQNNYNSAPERRNVTMEDV